jgi:hypothetical protein
VHGTLVCEDSVVGADLVVLDVGLEENCEILGIHELAL